MTSAPAPATRALRPIASPLPLGLLALTVGSIVLSSVELQWFPAAQDQVAAWCLLGFVVPTQLISFVFAIQSRDEGVASGLAVLSGAWFATALVFLGLPAGTTAGPYGVLLVAVAVVLIVPAVAAVGSKPLVTVVLGVAAARFAISGIYQLCDVHLVAAFSGGLGLLLTALALYAGAAFALEANLGPVRPPTFRRARDGHVSGQPVNEPEAGTSRHL